MRSRADRLVVGRSVPTSSVGGSPDRQALVAAGVGAGSGVLDCERVASGWCWRAGVLVLLCGLLGGLFAAPPEIEVTGVTQARAGVAKTVTVQFRCRDADGNPLLLVLLASADGGATWDAVPVRSLSGDRTVPATSAWRAGSLVWAAGLDWPEQVSELMRVKLTAEEMPLPPPTLGEFCRVPAGSFTMGNQEDEEEGWPSEQPPHTVHLSEFYMAKYEVTRALWDRVEDWGEAHGYEFLGERGGSGSHHPVCSVDWFDVLKWCNARSEQDGRQPCYFEDGDTLREGYPDEVTCDWSANGYRLPTEAEWEKSARGGLTDKRFPWGDTITHKRANYVSTFLLPYDKSSTLGYHPDYHDDWPFTSPVGSFPANGYGIYDQAGNVWEWCWDWFGEYPSSARVDPHGRSSGSRRVIRGGSYADNGRYCRVAARSSRDPGPWGGGGSDSVGFRLVIITP